MDLTGTTNNNLVLLENVNKVGYSGDHHGFSGFRNSIYLNGAQPLIDVL